ncbi:MAG: ribonuclease D [Pseudomonadota bacterium]
MIDFTMFTTDDAFAARCGAMAGEKSLAVDLEADSMHHFKEKVCLIQIADSSGPFIADPLAISDVSPLGPVFQDPGITKVFHGADFDIRSLDRDFNIRVNNLFDTEIACRLLGMPNRSLAALLKKYFNVDADKKFQKIDWSKRPLSQEMIVYSITDVLYLLELKEILEKRLIEAGRLSWAMEEFQCQANVRHDNNGTDPLFLKFKGAGKMGKRTLAVLEELLQMRRKIAKEKDRPLFKVISSEAIRKMAETVPGSMAQLNQLKILSPKQTGMYADACLEAIARGLDMPDADCPVYPKTRTPGLSPDVPQKIKVLKRFRDNLSLKTGIEPGFLINNTLISQLAAEPPHHISDLAVIPGMKTWQIGFMGNDIIRILSTGR